MNESLPLPNRIIGIAEWLKLVGVALGDSGDAKTALRSVRSLREELQKIERDLKATLPKRSR
jgi:hypothetical protein